ncbi:MAG: ABC transporter substrate-binding protein [Anaerolineae bacterium]|nr:ABC transporter substrate-binding protein [Anaerolineae bacterium]
MAQKPKITIGYLKITDHLILGVTADKLQKGIESFKYFDLELRPYTGWNPLAGDLRSGALDGACVLAPIAMELFHAGKKINVVMQTHKSGSIIVTNKRANIEKLEDFKGKAVLIPHYLSVHHLLFDKLLRESGMEIGAGKDIVFDVVAPSEIPEIIEWDEKGKVAGFIVAEPFGSQVIKSGYGQEFKLSKDIWPNHPCCVLALKEEVIEKNPDGVLELVSSLVKSGKFIDANPGPAAEIGATFLGQNLDVIQRVLSDKGRVTYNELYPVMQDFEFIQTYMTQTIQAMSDKIDLHSFLDTQFAREAGAN